MDGMMQSLYNSHDFICPCVNFTHGHIYKSKKAQNILNEIKDGVQMYATFNMYQAMSSEGGFNLLSQYLIECDMSNEMVVNKIAWNTFDRMT